MQKTVTVYLDVLLFINAVINFTILFLTYKTAGVKISKPRILFATALSSVYGTVVCLPQMEILLNVFFKIAVGLLTVIIAFEFVNLKTFFKRFFIFSAITFFYIGIIFVFQYIPFLSSTFFIRNGEVYFNLPFSYVMAAAGLLFVSVNIISRYFSKKIKRGDVVLCKAKIGENEISFSAFCDSGNFLSDPLSGRPVVLIKEKLVLPFLPENAEENLFSALENDENFKTKIRIIPFSTAAKKDGIMVGFIPDRFFVEETEKEIILAPEKDLFENKDYDAILNL